MILECSFLTHPLLWLVQSDQAINWAKLRRQKPDVHLARLFFCRNGFSNNQSFEKCLDSSKENWVSKEDGAGRPVRYRWTCKIQWQISDMTVNESAQVHFGGGAVDCWRGRFFLKNYTSICGWWCNLWFFFDAPSSSSRALVYVLRPAADDGGFLWHHRFKKWREPRQSSRSAPRLRKLQ